MPVRERKTRQQQSRASVLIRSEPKFWRACETGWQMARKLTELSPESLARAHRQRLAAEEGARAIADVERDAVAVRKNMERLRALRVAKEAEDAAQAELAPPPP